MDILAKRLKHLREQHKERDSKFTQGYIANLIGVARVTYTAYENGTKQPPIETVNKLADIFEVSTDYLQGRVDKPTKVNEDSNHHLSANDLKVLEEIKKHPLLFHELANAPEKKIRQLIKMWDIIKEDLEEYDDHDEIIED